MRTPQACQQVYCWQTVCALELWARLLGAHAHSAVRSALWAC